MFTVYSSLQAILVKEKIEEIYQELLELQNMFTQWNFAKSRLLCLQSMEIILWGKNMTEANAQNYNGRFHMQILFLFRDKQ